MKRAWLLLAATAAVITGWGLLFSATQHASVVTGLYWAVTTATTVGYGDVAPHGASGEIMAIAVMLTAIPLLAATFSHIHLGRVKTHLERRLAEHHQAIHGRLDKIEREAKSGVRKG